MRSSATDPAWTTVEIETIGAESPGESRPPVEDRSGSSVDPELRSVV
jgi:hypothetical protein